MFILKATQKRCNPYAPYTDAEGTQHIRMPASLYDELPDPQPPEDYSEDTYYRTEQDDAPYLAFTRKSDEHIAQTLNARNAAARVAAYQTVTDPLFFKEQRGEVPPGTWLAAVTAIKLLYPKLEVPDGEQSVIPNGA